MHIEDRDKRDSITHDPQIQGFNGSFWGVVSGTPPAISGGILEINAATIGSYLNFTFTELCEFVLTVPSVPTVGQARRWGLYSPAASLNGQSQNNIGIGSIYFDIAGTAFTVNVEDANGNVQSKTITWQSAWTNKATQFAIAWEPDVVRFWIDQQIVATFNVTSGATAYGIPYTPLPLYISNGASDNLGLNYLDIRRAAMMI
jgi:hypothetical protein